MPKVFYADPEPQGGYGSTFMVAYYFDDFSMTILPNADPRVVAFVDGGSVIEAYVTPEPPPATPSTPTLYAIAQLTISAGEISGIGLVSRFSAAMWMDVGSYYIFFAETLPDTSYVAKAYRDGNAFALGVAEKAEDYIVLTATDAEGAPADPPDVTIEIIRIL